MTLFIACILLWHFKASTGWFLGAIVLWAAEDVLTSGNSQ